MGKKFNIEDKIGKTFGELKIIKYNNKDDLNGHTYVCRCSCDNEVIKTYSYLTNKRTIKKSCGCKAREGLVKYNIESKTALFDNEYWIEANYLYIKTIGVKIEYIFKFDKEFLNQVLLFNRRLKVDKRGYCYITLGKDNKYGVDSKRQIFLHNFIVYGLDYYRLEMSKDMVADHINCDNKDNRSENLRKATIGNNNKNSKTRVDSTTGVKGLTLKKEGNKCTFIARVQTNNKRDSYNRVLINLEDLRKGIAWLVDKRIEKHGEFANFGVELKEQKEIEKELFEIALSFLHKQGITLE